MTKTTSYEISKKLKEAGFGKSSAFAHFKSKCGGGGIFYVWEGIKGGYEKEFFSYDLETLLDALPDSITREYKSKQDGEVREFKERLIIEKEEIHYSCDDIENADDANRYFNEYGYMQDISLFKKFNDNSLADTAGKMWLLLKEKGMVC